MGELSAIEWTHSTWNPWRGCTKVDPTCANCYMFTGQRRAGRDPSVVTRCAPATFNAPLSPKWARVRADKLAEHGQHLVFTCSWSDWFHADADDWRDEAWDVIRSCPDSVFQILTSRPERIAEHLPADWGDGWPNVWLGVTIGNRKFVHRADLLRAAPAARRFISAEPLLGPLVCPRCLGARWIHAYDANGPAAVECTACDLEPRLDLNGIDWLIIGGESGGRPGRRLIDAAGAVVPAKLEWIRDLHRACNETGTLYHFKQLGGTRPGGSLDALPEYLRGRAIPPLRAPVLSE